MPINANAKTMVRLYPEEVLIFSEDYLLYNIQVETSNLVNLIEYNITVDYDPEILSIENHRVAVKRDEGLYPHTFRGSAGLWRSSPPQFLHGEVKYSEPLSGTGPLVSVSFKVLMPANTTVTFEINELIDDQGNEIEYEFPNNVVVFTTKKSSIESSSGIPGFSILSVFIGIVAVLFLERTHAPKLGQRHF